MRVPLSWLREYVDFDFTAEELAERLTALGFELQGIERIGSDWSDVVVGELLEVAPHPGAHSLSLTRVVVQEGGEPLSVVCGATNIHAGQRVPVALPGAVLPGGRQIGVSRIQGADSQGMLCSGDELRLTPDADGILILPPETPLGRPLADVLGEVVLDLDVKPNRGDALSLIGLAREVAAISGGRLRWPEISVPEAGDMTAEHLSVEVEDAQLCPRFVGRYVDSLSVAPSPLEVQLRLGAAGLRPVSNVVDASNYVMLELGKPIHTFDAAAVAKGRIIVRLARAGERLETLDHIERELSPDTLLIADPNGPLGIAGVMGGASSEVGEGTTAVIVESAIFDPISIRRTAQRYGLRSEASARFEKGQEKRLALLGADRTAQLIAAWAGGRPAAGVVDTDPSVEGPRRLAFRPARIGRLVGEALEAPLLQSLLARVEIASEPARPGDTLSVVEGEEPLVLDEDSAEDALVALVPSHRRDLAIEADVTEEVARLHGYEQILPRLPDTPMPVYRPEPRRFADEVRVLLAGRGLAEVVTNGLIGPQDHAALGLPADDPATIRVANPVTEDHAELRRSLLPGLVRVLVLNERQRREDVAVFELGPVHEMGTTEPRQRTQLGILLAGSWLVQGWSQPARKTAVDDVKGMIEVVAQRLGVGGVHYRATQVREGVEHPGRTATAWAGTARDESGEVELGRIGEVDPRLLARYEARSERAAFALLDMATLRRLARDVAQVGRLPRLPAVERDLAVVVSRDLPQLDVEHEIRAAAGPLLERLSLFDRYSGPPLETGEVSLAYRLRFQPMDRAPAEGELDELVQGIAQRLAERLSARLRA
ncbi:MAG TPA: phenylalanine--tRNA ligase subunit beta [Candidatus Limnocylindria bacterium]|nr:phenylalanine--tRNA ligase subunit beta [Candidatus Limnocylindria bacterium]